MSRGTRDLKEVVVTARRGSNSEGDALDEESSRKLNKLKALSDSDKDLITQLQASIHEKNKELENRNVTIQAIQRNFENLSAICHSDRVELADLRKWREEQLKEMARLHGLLNEAKDRNKNLESDLGTAGAAADAYQKLKVQHADLTDSYKRLEEAHNHSVRRTKELDTKVKDLDLRYNTVTRENNGLQAAINELQRSLEELKKDSKDGAGKMGAECARLEREKRDLQVTIQRLEETISRLESSQGNKEKELSNERKRLEDKIAKLESSLSDEQARSAELEERLAAEAAALQEANRRAADLEGERDAYVRRMQGEMDAAQQAIARLEGSLREAQGMLIGHGDKDEEIARLRQAVSEAEQHARDEAELMRVEVGDLKADLSRVQDENRQLNLALKSSMTAEAEIAKLRLEVKRLKEFESESESAKAALKKLERRVEGMEQTNKALKDELEGARSKMKSMGDEMKDLARRAKGFDPDEVSKELRATVSKLAAATEADEAALTCMQCMNIFTNPITCNPCGHTFCQGCVGKLMDPCQECGHAITHKIIHENLEQMASKLVYKKQAMTALMDMCKISH